MYVLRNERRVFFVDRTVRGSRRSQNIDLLRCEEHWNADCEAFGYKYQGVISTYGFHNHE
jgi:hypothetical protein